MSSIDPTGAEWVKSSYSDGQGGQCVEWLPSHAMTHGVVPVRDSKNPHGLTLTFSGDGWSSFVSSIRGEEFPTI
ncbi:DUF397 domain-containing protein [Streptomyces muensis]|uniref:DUF397 domain-containing protein n=1 Tax=Streptomyces muensis TaxID=1077944 RepID=A0A9X1TTF4_STRM4|nr:DUF397 domain-containing protein [Streptomyces muensis]MCF1595408.1 DUF397 domain-containing protein [Streptomyces muensis]